MPPLSGAQRAQLLADLGSLRKYCLTLTGNADDADDLLQITVERVLDKGMPADAHASKWAYRVCKNAWIDEVRSREVRQRYPQQWGQEEADSAPSAELEASGEREITAVAAALNQLPPDQRLTLTLVAVDGKSYAEAAEILEVPVGTVMSRIARARKNLVKLYSTTERE